MPFDFLNLPQEVQDMILVEHLRCDSLTVKSRHGRSECLKTYYKGVPSLAIESVCRKLSTDAKQLRSQLWPRTLHFDHLETTIFTRVTRASSAAGTALGRAIVLVGTYDRYR